ncbi:hypothetical protein [Selenomonas sp.]|uniref:hypothetical protein n=1 Tax=Selenomonas sp. TaxID=2053611 RepID=UPI0025F6D93C|nr:hypothetical protein [Selenomonas sp.]MCI6282959.1 hypothetical protein [Selenomonas sp.]
MKEILKHIFVYVSFVVIGTAFYAGSFRTPLFVSMPVFYYRACFLLATVTMLVLLAMLVCRRKQLIQLDWKDVVITVMAFFFLNFSFLSLVLVSLDRSISVFVLSEMTTHETKVYSKDEIRHLIYDVWLNDYNAAERRIDEQLVSKNIEPVGDGYRISLGGKRFILLCRKIAVIFPVDDKFLYPRE